MVSHITLKGISIVFPTRNRNRKLRRTYYLKHSLSTSAHFGTLSIKSKRHLFTPAYPAVCPLLSHVHVHLQSHNPVDGDGLELVEGRLVEFSELSDRGADLVDTDRVPRVDLARHDLRPVQFHGKLHV